MGGRDPVGRRPIDTTLAAAGVGRGADGDAHRRGAHAAARDRQVTMPTHRAGGAHQFRDAGWLERLAARARGRLGPAGGPLRRLYHAALRVQTGGNGVASRLPGGETVRALPDRGGLIWNPDEYVAFRAAVRPGMTALDVGANAGAYALLLGQWVGASGRVYAFEPSPRIFDTLSRHIALNGLTNVVTPIPLAVAESSGVGALVIAPTTGESRLKAVGDGAGGIVIGTVSIDAFCADRGLEPDFIKVDVEGAELDVLRGARDTIRRLGARLALFVEMHPSVWTAQGVRPAAVIEHIRALGLEPDRPWDEVLRVDGLCARLRAAER